MMNVVEVARMTECLKALGLSDAEIIIVQNYIATGVGLLVKCPPFHNRPCVFSAGKRLLLLSS